MDIADLYHEAQEKHEESGSEDPFMSFADFCAQVEEEEIDRDLDRRYPSL